MLFSVCVLNRRLSFLMMWICWLRRSNFHLSNYWCFWMHLKSNCLMMSFYMHRLKQNFCKRCLKMSSCSRCLKKWTLRFCMMKKSWICVHLKMNCRSFRQSSCFRKIRTSCCLMI